MSASPEHHLRRVAAAQAHYLRNDSGPLWRDRPQARLPSNKSVRGKHALNYLCSLAVDEGHGFISHVQTDFADRHDNLLMPSIVEPLYQRLLAHDPLIVDVGADTSYSNGLKYALPEAQPPTWIPVFGYFKPEIEGFTYDKATNYFTYPTGKPLPFKRFD